jgi:heptaprenyl diphosphate synthase
VAADLAAVEERLRQEIAQDPEEVGAAMADLFEAGGKRIRPGLVLLSATFGRYDIQELAPAAMAVELMHAATLVHDDVIDRSAMRRGRPTVAASLGDEPAIVVGDFYFAKAYELAARTQTRGVVGALAHAVMDICAGEVRQQEIRYRYTTTQDEYMRRIEAKTATLVSACCDIGALLSGLDTEKRAAFRRYGRQLGLAFQIADDVLDYTGTEGEVGKPIGHDLEEGFATLPLMLALEEDGEDGQLRRKLQHNRKLTAGDAHDLVERVRAGRAPQRALERAREHASAARDELKILGPSEAADTLATLADYVVSRKL